MNYPYAFIPVTLAVIILYLISWGLSGLGHIRGQTHRRIWNTLLLLAFLVSGLLGVFLVIQINYKLEIPWIKKVLKWHVDFGLALVCLAMIHLGWHLRYYWDSWKAPRRKPDVVVSQKNTGILLTSISKRSVIMALLVLGFSGIMTQLIVIREFLNVFQGNELIMGMILFTWMILTAAGSKLGYPLINVSTFRKNLARCFLVAGLLPLVMITLLYVAESLVFPPGTTKGPVTAFIFCLFLLIPFCLLTGMLFTMLATGLSHSAQINSVSRAYSWESLGSMFAGLLFSLILVYWLRTYQVLAMILFLNLVMYVMILPFHKATWADYLIPFLLLIVTVYQCFRPADIWIRALHFKNQELVYTQDSPFGNISVTKTAGQYNFYGSNALLFSTENTILQEEAVHFALLQRPKPMQVLIVSGGIAGMTLEVLKYPSVKLIDYLEINPWLVKAEKKFSTIQHNSRLRIRSKDARTWIRNTKPKYDAIIINTPDPSNAQINRFYTLEFFSEVKKALRTHGVFLISLSPTGNYMSPTAKELHRVVYQTLKKAFPQVVVIPGERNYYIASEEKLRTDIANAVEKTGIENAYVQPGYIEDDLLLQKSRLILDEIGTGSVTCNQDLVPRVYLLQIQHWLTIFQWNIKIIWLLIALLILMLMLILRLRFISPVAAGIFTGGMAGASLLFLVLIFSQILYGQVYQMLGVIVALYMTGLALGSGPGIPVKISISPRNYIRIQWLLMIMLLLFPFVVASLNQLGTWMGQGLLLITTAVTAFITGFEFYTGSRIEQQHPEKIAGNLYSVDLAGSALGILMVSMLLFPWLGLLYTCLVLAAMVIMSIAVMYLAVKKYRN
jgi:spermidine synthase